MNILKTTEQNNIMFLTKVLQPKGQSINGTKQVQALSLSSRLSQQVLTPKDEGHNKASSCLLLCLESLEQTLPLILTPKDAGHSKASSRSIPGSSYLHEPTLPNKSL